MIRVLIVDDSPVVAQLLSYILSSDPVISILGIASHGEEAIAMTASMKPDLITMDIHMPGMDGFEATRSIMESMAVPIIIVSSVYDPKEISLSFRAVAAGALSILAKPVGIGHPAHEKQARELINMVKAMSDVRVVTRKLRIASGNGVSVKAEQPAVKREIKMIAIGASTGGPPVLQAILSGLPKNLPIPITIVQHIAQGFTTGFAAWLADTTGFTVRVPENGEICEPGTAYIAPDSVHLVVDHGGRILLNNDPPDNLLKPSVAHLFSSIAKVYREKAIGVLLTGMGRDGADGMKLMSDAGAITIAQDRESSIVFGMNGEAVKLGAAKYVLPPEGIVKTLTMLVAGK